MEETVEKLEEYLVGVVGEVDLVENLSGFVLDGLHLDLVRRILALTVPDRLLEALHGVQGYRVRPRAQELVQLLRKPVMKHW